MADSSSIEIGEAKAALEYLVTPSQLFQTLQHCLSSRTADGIPKAQANVMVWGAMGIGKTDVNKSVGALWNLRIVALHLPQFDPTDLKGIPVFVDTKGRPAFEQHTDDHGKVKWVPSSYLPQFMDRTIDEDCVEAKFGFDWSDAEGVMVHVYGPDGEFICRYNDQMNGDMNPGDLNVSIDMLKGTVIVKGKLVHGTKIQIIDKAIIFLDELSAAVPEVQNAALQLVLDKRVGEYDVPPYTPLVAAGNRESDQAFVSPMSMPLCNRFIHLRLIHNLADWTDWAIINRVDASIIGYLQWKKNHLFIFEPDTITEGDCGFPTPRSWAKLSEQMVGLDGLPDVVAGAIITGAIGRTIGAMFIEHRKVAHLMPKPDDILRGKAVNMPDDMNVGSKYHLAMGLCYALSDFHEKYFDEAIGSDDDNAKQCKEWKTAASAFCKFIDEELGKEMSVLCIHIVSRHLGISFVKFRGENFKPFATEYRDILRKTV